jgi:hypothetical protein
MKLPPFRLHQELYIWPHNADKSILDAKEKRLSLTPLRVVFL